MLINYSDIKKKNYDYCIIGSGVAGSIIADRLSKKFKILLIEGGGKYVSEKSQNLYQGKTFGDDYNDLTATRLRFMGGTSNHWGGLSRPLDPIDFQRIPASNIKWPIKFEDLNSFIDEAINELNLKNYEKDEIIYDSPFVTKQFHRSDPVFRANEKYFEKFKKSKNVDLVLNLNFYKINLNTKNNETYISDIDCKDYNYNIHKINAKKYILCCGGIENNRLLLWTNAVYNNKVFNSELLGRYWTEHPHFSVADAIIFDENDSIFLGDKSYTNRIRKFIGLKDDIIKKEKILNCSLRVNYHNKKDKDKLIEELKCIAPNLSRKIFDTKWRYDSLASCGIIIIRSSWEQEPRSVNRIEIDFNDVDILGIPKTNLYYKKSVLDFKTIKTNLDYLGNYLVNSNRGRIKYHEWIANELISGRLDDERVGNHHMGGTRMGENKADGIVDKNLKSFDVENLYVCGSSVFPRGGFANPTLTIAQLSIRLANYLNSSIY